MITHAGSSEVPSALLQQPDGKLVAAGSFSASDATDNLLARYGRWVVLPPILNPTLPNWRPL